MNKKLTFLSALVFVLSVSLFVGWNTNDASAFSNRYPDPADTTQSANVIAVNSQTRYVQVSDSKLRIWYPNRTNNSLTIRNGNFCAGNPGDLMETEDGGWGSIADGRNITTFRLVGVGVAQGKKGRDCNAEIRFSNFNIPATQTELGYYYVELNINYVNHNPGPDGVMNYYSILAEGQPNVLIGLVGNHNGYQSTQEQLDAAPANINYRVPFGTPCGRTQAQSATIDFWDLDNAGGSGAQLGGDVQIRLWDRTANGDVVLTPGGAGWWTPPSRDNRKQSVTFLARPGHKYRLEINNVYRNNTIQWSIPFNQIFSLQCPEAKLNPNVSIVPGGVTVDTVVTADAEVVNGSAIRIANYNYRRAFWLETTATGAAPTYDAGTDKTAHTQAAASDSLGASNTRNFSAWNYRVTQSDIDAGYKRICTSLQILSNGLDPSDTEIVPQNPEVKCRRINASSEIAIQPFLSIYAGDALAGSSPTLEGQDLSGPNVSSTCYNDNPEAGIYSWNQGDAGDFAGAGTELAARALGRIEGFATATGTTKPAGLAFANTAYDATAPTENGLFGGNYGAADARCDFTSDLGTPTAPAAAYPLASERNGLSGQITHYVKGDVFIDQDITYNGTNSWTDPDDIPQYKLIVAGDIYIKYNVGTLSGMYVAMPDDAGNGGHIYTCASGPGQASLPTVSNFTNCSQQLTVYGAFVAKQVLFLRWYGNVSEATSDETYRTTTSAETFVYSPELWVVLDSGLDLSSDSSIIGLPPVL